MKPEAAILHAISDSHIHEEGDYLSGYQDGLKEALRLTIGKARAEELLTLPVFEATDAIYAVDAENGWHVLYRSDGADEDGNEFIRLGFIEDHKVVSVQVFHHSRAYEDAGSFMAAAEESERYTLEERLGPFGIEWQREQEERRGGVY